MCAGLLIAMAAYAGLSSRNLPESSSAKCMASLMDPPFPQQRILPPERRQALMASEAESMDAINVSSSIKLDRRDSDSRKCVRATDITSKVWGKRDTFNMLRNCNNKDAYFI